MITEPIPSSQLEATQVVCADEAGVEGTQEPGEEDNAQQPRPVDPLIECQLEINRYLQGEVQREGERYDAYVEKWRRVIQDVSEGGPVDVPVIELLDYKAEMDSYFSEALSEVRRYRANVEEWCRATQGVSAEGGYSGVPVRPSLIRRQPPIPPASMDDTQSYHVSGPGNTHTSQFLAGPNGWTNSHVPPPGFGNMQPPDYEPEDSTGSSFPGINLPGLELFRGARNFTVARLSITSSRGNPSNFDGRMESVVNNGQEGSGAY
ncbi:hypothetical protein DFP72DRAFT_1060442 [Ephemerocybe angulata]|uniref:Uncharacterized protein n=1 Tax=Ephemerocybe angulata TaxID=980116 RepID=A0A8H6IFB2_9AGAR|nr:hypothetical protein DFP72DRAFT_1060442 [Tulosesus angulatus]